MNDANTQWRLDVVAQTNRLAGVAMDNVHDANEAHFMVHGVIARAMSDMLAPVSMRQLDAALDRALLKYLA